MNLVNGQLSILEFIYNFNLHTIINYIHTQSKIIRMMNLIPPKNVIVKIMIFCWSNHCWGSTLPTIMRKIPKTPYPRFHRFCYEYILNIFSIISHDYLLFSHIIV